MKVLKMIGTTRFTLSLCETESGLYFVEWEIDEKVTMTQKVSNLNDATFLFTHKLQELEGN